MNTREKLYQIIFGTTTKAGRIFDLVLLFFILISVTTIIIESVPEWRSSFGKEFYYIEWFFTILFTLEYLTRIIVSPKPLKYIFSTWGIIDLLSILPTFISPFLSNNVNNIRIIRALRLLRVFRIFQLSQFTSEYQELAYSLKASFHKIIVFLVFVFMVMILSGTLMYVVEGGTNGFESIPSSIYWAIVTTTTVGYGDIVPVTTLGKIISSMMMIVGYSIIAVPTGIISFEMTKYKPETDNIDNKCSYCDHENPFGSIYCNQCGKEITL